jgi:hypothetical protein
VSGAGALGLAKKLAIKERDLFCASFSFFSFSAFATFFSVRSFSYNIVSAAKKYQIPRAYLGQFLGINGFLRFGGFLRKGFKEYQT